MKKQLMILLLVATMFSTATALAAAKSDNFSDDGVYVVAQAGAGSVSLGFFDDFLRGIDMKNNTGFAGRIGIGYQFNRYFAMEGGFSAYPSAIRNYSSNRALLGGDIQGNSKISNIYSADLMGALRVPIGNYFFITGEAGAAVVHFSYAAMDASDSNFTALAWQPGSAYFVAPKAGLKLGVKINSKTSVFLSTSYIFSANGTNPEKRNYQPGLAMANIGMSYSF